MASVGRLLSLLCCISVTPWVGCGEPKESKIVLLPEASGEDGHTACSSDGDCAPPVPYCDTDSRYCVECLTNTNCGNKVCNLAVHSCQDCQTSGDCSGHNPYCSAGSCVECLEPGNCPDAGSTCDTTENKCVVLCTADTECTEGARLLCALERQVCVECLEDADCDTSKPRCVADKCKACIADTDCLDPTPFCRLDRNECKECLVDSDCPDGLRCDNYACKE